MMRKCFLLTLSVILGFSTLWAQTKVTGKVTSAEEGTPMAYVTVVVEGTTIATQTNVDGVYSITVPSGSQNLVFTFMGTKTQVIAVNDRAVIDVVMQLDTKVLTEVIMVAYGTSTKEAFTGSAAVVSEKKLERTQVSNVTNALAGAVPGVQLTSNNGAPGVSSTIRIRGIGSISAGNDPLVIVDGVPYSQDIASLNPNDIESMTVLKDAASNALYGARGANGVIMIATKKAKRGEALVTVDIKAGINQKALQNYNKMTSPAMYYEAHYKALANYYQNKMGMNPYAAMLEANKNLTSTSANGGVGYMVYSVPEGQLFMGLDGKMNPNATLGNVVGDYYMIPDDWEEAGFRNGIRQEYQVSVAGANEKANYYSTISYLSNEGITDASDMTRITARLKAEYQAKKWLKMGSNFSYTNFDYNSLGNNASSGSTGNIWAYTSQMAPIYPLYVRNADKTIKIDPRNNAEMMDYGSGDAEDGYPGFARPFLAKSNALSQLRFDTNNSEGNAATASSFFDINIFDGLKLTVNGAVNLDETRATWVYNPYYGQFAAEKGLLGKEHYRSISYDFQQLLNYNKKFGKHNVGALLGHEYYNSKYYGLYASKNNMFSQKNKELNGAVTDKQSSGSYLNEYNTEGYFVRALYDYDTKYFLSASYRRDATSRFNPKHRWGNFWSAGAAWIMSKENWFRTSWVDELKFKFSIGSQGNDNIGDYRYTDLFAIVPSAGNVSTMFSDKGSENITWETNMNVNAGVEFSFLGKITGSIDYFDRITTDMLFSFPVCPSMGYDAYFANVGDMRNMGAELTVNFNIINRKNLQWDINLNATFLKNRITMLDPAKKTTKVYDAEGNMYEGYESGSTFIAEDLSLRTWYLKEFAGVNQKTGESEWFYDELDEKGERTGKRKTTTDWSKATYYVTNETAIAPFYGGFGTTLNAYGFDFTINCSYQIGGKLYDNGYAASMRSPVSATIGNNYHVDILDSWTPEKPSKTIPRFQYGDTYSAGGSTRFLTDASYLNIENINVGYTLPQKWTNKIGGERCSLRLYFACDNVWYWSKRQGFDPRAGGSEAYYSPMRTISGGITVKF